MGNTHVRFLKFQASFQEAAEISRNKQFPRSSMNTSLASSAFIKIRLVENPAVLRSHQN